MPQQYPEQVRAETLEFPILEHDLEDTYPGVEKTPGVCGGAACIVRTRIPVWGLVQAQRLGMSDAELLAWYPALQAVDLKNAWAYFGTHREEVEEQIRRNEEA